MNDPTAEQYNAVADTIITALDDMNLATSVTLLYEAIAGVVTIDMIDVTKDREVGIADIKGVLAAINNRGAKVLDMFVDATYDNIVKAVKQ